jgi:hypothetical protein
MDLICGTDVPFEFDGCYKAYVAKKVSKEDDNIRADGNIGNLIYKKHVGTMPLVKKNSR